MNIKIEVIEPGTHRPNIEGADWFWDDDGNLIVRVSKMSDWRYEMILAIHETVEAIMCKHNGVTQQQVDDFDMPFVINGLPDLEAGDENNAPYRVEHTFATAIERILAGVLDVKWRDYDKELAQTK